jgi:molecular chaperone GrpE
MISPDNEHDDIDPSEDEVDFEPEDELGETGAAKAKMVKLRAELKEAQQKRDEYLDGWQRAKADMINAKKDAAEAAARAAGRGKEILVEELIPALDGFDMAMQGEAWNSVDKAWRSGIESIKSQIENVLKAHGVEIFGKEGEQFDPAVHEPIQEAEGGVSHTVAKVFRRGYRTKERVLRPAQVAIFT